MKNLIKLSKINKKLYISISSNPGKVGMRFYNSIFKKMRLNMTYRAIKPPSLHKIFILIRSGIIKGCSVSMPYKNKVYKYVDYFDEVSKNTKIINTIINKRGKIYGYNCDYEAINKIFKKYKINKSKKILIYGSGSITNLLVYFLKKKQFRKITLKARNNKKVLRILKKYKLKKFTFNDYDILINTSSLGMKGHPKKIMFSDENIKNAKLIIDFVNKPKFTNLIKLAKFYKKNYCDGIEISSNQLKSQFKLYTGQNLQKKYYLI